MLCAFHCGQTKPNLDLMFKPIIDELVTYEKTPLSILINEEKKLFFKDSSYNSRCAST